MKRLFIILFAFAWLHSCDDGPVFSEIPEITFVSNSESEIVQFDELIITIHYQDGDGDLGFLDGETNVHNLFLVDNRSIIPDSVRVISYAIPSLTPETRRPSIQGTIDIAISPPHGSIFDPTLSADEEVIYDVYLLDRADHTSNIIKTDPVTIKRN